MLGTVARERACEGLGKKKTALIGQRVNRELWRRVRYADENLIIFDLYLERPDLNARTNA